MERKPTFQRSANKKPISKKMPAPPKFVVKGKHLTEEEIIEQQMHAQDNLGRYKSQRRTRVTKFKGFLKRRAKNKVARKQRRLNRRLS